MRSKIIIESVIKKSAKTSETVQVTLFLPSDYLMDWKDTVRNVHNNNCYAYNN